MTDLSTEERGEGSTVYRGTVPAGKLASKSAVKNRKNIRVLPFGYAAPGEAADPSNPIQVSVVVARDGVIRTLTAGWGSPASRWIYEIDYRDLGTTPAPAPPANARPLREVVRSTG
jgi:hypothetical protein